MLILLKHDHRGATSSCVKICSLPFVGKRAFWSRLIKLKRRRRTSKHEPTRPIRVNISLFALVFLEDFPLFLPHPSYCGGGEKKENLCRTMFWKFTQAAALLTNKPVLPPSFHSNRLFWAWQKSIQKVQLPD